MESVPEISEVCPMRSQTVTGPRNPQKAYEDHGHAKPFQKQRQGHRSVILLFVISGSFRMIDAGLDAVRIMSESGLDVNDPVRNFDCCRFVKISCAEPGNYLRSGTE